MREVVRDRFAPADTRSADCTRIGLEPQPPGATTHTTGIGLPLGRMVTQQKLPPGIADDLLFDAAPARFYDDRCIRRHVATHVGGAEQVVHPK